VWNKTCAPNLLRVEIPAAKGAKLLDIQFKEADNWELGCSSDRVRNEIIIPDIAQTLNQLRPINILDVGCATGYIFREIQKNLLYEPSWFCLDKDKNRIDYAKNNKSSQTIPKYILGDFLSANLGRYDFDALIFSFTLLEIGITQPILTRIRNLSNPTTRLILALPDAWSDVLYSEGDPLSLGKEFIRGTLSLHKIDKFTGLNYPFQAIRIESVISQILCVDFALERLKRYELEGKGIFLLTFGRR
jgi:SAM-dependent methyltransferase